MDPAVEKKHLRYLAQSEWTKPFREYLYRKLPDDRPLSILEIGCGTGALIRCVETEFPGKIGLSAGADIDRNALEYAKDCTGSSSVQADGMDLPFSDGTFDFVFCHYLLLWTEMPERVITEMKRVTKSGGLCAAMAEPDYGEMTAKPDPLRMLAQKQARALINQGAALSIGHKLGDLFRRAGFQNCRSGCYETGNMDRGFLVREISQMAEDCGDARFEIDDQVNYVYNVPTYYAYSVK